MKNIPGARQPRVIKHNIIGPYKRHLEDAEFKQLNKIKGNAYDDKQNIKKYNFSNNNISQKIIQHIPTLIEEMLLKAAKGKGDT